MKIGKQRVKGLVMKHLASGAIYYGWEPSPRERAAGWKSIKLDGPLERAIEGANKRNTEVAEWRDGGAKPATVRRYIKARTFGALIDRYEREKLPRLAPNTQRVDRGVLHRLQKAWGKHPVAWITRARVATLRDELMKGVELNGAGHAVAYHQLSVLRRVFSWAVAHPERLAADNPAADFDLPIPQPRDQVWEQEDFDAFARAAIAEQLPEINFAVELAAWMGQREGDMIRLTAKAWQEYPPLDTTQTRALAGGDGRVMGFMLKQSKTGRWVGVPIAHELRDKVEAAMKVNARRQPAVATILVNPANGLPWMERAFIRAFDQVRQRAVREGHTRLADLQFRDLRRTCIVRMNRKGLNDAQISSISGHKLETIKRILETYAPRDLQMSASAAVAMLPSTVRKQNRNSDLDEVGTPS